jgi:lipopolysaccharide export system permease protein
MHLCNYIMNLVIKKYIDRIPKIDLLLIKSFVPPFIGAFFVALFILTMQTLWVYVDDIMGKGVDFFTLTKVLLFLSVSLFPMAFGIGVLLSTVMIMGSLAENYELSAFNSAGVSLIRVLRPLFYCSVVVAFLSLFCAYVVTPFANLKWRSALYDIRTQKPTLSMAEGVFNYGFEGMVMRVGKKNADNKRIEDVLMYEQNYDSRGKLSLVVAKSGKLETSQGGQYMVMTMNNGNQYIEADDGSGSKGYPFVRIKFKEWKKVLDLGQFSLNRTEENLFKSNFMMQSPIQLLKGIDSLQEGISFREKSVESGIADIYYPLRKSKVDRIRKERDRNQDSIVKAENKLRNVLIPNEGVAKNIAKLNPNFLPALADSNSLKYQDRFYDYFATVNSFERSNIFSRAKGSLATLQSQAELSIGSVERDQEALAKYLYEFNLRHALAFSCILFLFIGAPMGAIVRKGGYGFPFIVAVSFFIVFIFLLIYFKKIAEAGVMNGALAAWMPCLILVPIAGILSYRAMKDVKMGDISIVTHRIKSVFMGIYNLIKKRKEV